MTPRLHPDTVVVASRDQVSTTLSGDTVILGLKDGVYYGLDVVGTRVWEVLQEPRPLQDAAGALTRVYRVEPDQALSDVLRLASDLVERGLLHVVDAPAP